MFFETNLGGGGGEIKFTQLGSLNTTSTTEQTISLSDSMSNYDLIIVTHAQITNNKLEFVDSINNGIVMFPPSYLTTSNNVTMYFASGNTGSAIFRNSIVKKTNDTSLTVKQSYAITRDYYVYGAKA